MSSESTDEMAWRLAWTSQWRLQQESRHIEPTLEKMIGHLSVFNHTSEYMQTHEVSSGTSSPEIGVGHVEDISIGAEEDDEGDSAGEQTSLLASMAKNDARPKLVRSDAVVVTAVEIDDDEEGAEEGDPFSDEEEASSHGGEEDEDDDDDGWSSDEENEFDSVSSVEDESGSQDALLASKLPTIHEEESDAGVEIP